VSLGRQRDKRKKKTQRISCLTVTAGFKSDTWSAVSTSVAIDSDAAGPGGDRREVPSDQGGEFFPLILTLTCINIINIFKIIYIKEDSP
jgi:hypothetical protein